MQCNIEQRLRELSVENSKTNPKPEQQLQYDKTLFDEQTFLAHELSKIKPGHLLNVGAAYGTIDVLLQEMGWKVTALDVTTDLSSPKWWKKHGIEFKLANIETDSVDGDYEAVLFAETIEHLGYNPVIALENLYEATAHGGFIIVTTPAKELAEHVLASHGRYVNYAHYRDIPEYHNGYEPNDEHNYLYAKGELTQLLEEVGYIPRMAYPIRYGKYHFIIAQKPDAKHSHTN